MSLWWVFLKPWNRQTAVGIDHRAGGELETSAGEVHVLGGALAGILVPPGQEAAFDAFLAALAYPYVDDTDDPACRLFL